MTFPVFHTFEWAIIYPMKHGYITDLTYLSDNSNNTVISRLASITFFHENLLHFPRFFVLWIILNHVRILWMFYSVFSAVLSWRILVLCINRKSSCLCCDHRFSLAFYVWGSNLRSISLAFAMLIWICPGYE